MSLKLAKNLTEKDLDKINFVLPITYDKEDPRLHESFKEDTRSKYWYNKGNNIYYGGIQVVFEGIDIEPQIKLYGNTIHDFDFKQYSNSVKDFRVERLTTKTYSSTEICAKIKWNDLEIPISGDSLELILSECTIKKGVVKDECSFIFESVEYNTLVPKSSKKYKDYISQLDSKTTSVKSRTVSKIKSGSIYTTSSDRVNTFLGYYYEVKKGSRYDSDFSVRKVGKINEIRTTCWSNGRSYNFSKEVIERTKKIYSSQKLFDEVMSGDRTDPLKIKELNESFYPHIWNSEIGSSLRFGGKIDSQDPDTLVVDKSITSKINFDSAIIHSFCDLNKKSVTNLWGYLNHSIWGGTTKEDAQELCDKLNEARKKGLSNEVTNIVKDHYKTNILDYYLSPEYGKTKNKLINVNI